jgi:hypothetical protein
MITVRFPSGFSVQYNDLCAMKWGSDGTIMLYTSAADRDAGKGWKVAVPKEALVEFVSPCRTYSAVRDETTETVRALMASEFKTIQRQIRNLRKEAVKR